MNDAQQRDGTHRAARWGERKRSYNRTNAPRRRARAYKTSSRMIDRLYKSSSFTSSSLRLR